MIKTIVFTDFQGRLIILFLILFGLGVTLYLPSLLSLSSSVLHREGSSHGLFVPFFSGYLLWLKFAKIKQLPPQTNWSLGVVVTLIGSILFFLSNYSEYSRGMAFLSFLCVSGGLILLLFGSAMFKKTAFPLFFLATMLPIPPAIYATIAEQIRLSSTWGSVIIAKSLGVPLYRENFMIHLPKIDLFVAPGCSGIRYLLSYFVVGLFYAALVKKSMVGRLVVILGIIPLAIFGGIVRVSTIILAAYYINPAMAGVRPHIFISWTVFVTLLIGIIALDQYFSKARS
jgi:exosortase